MTKISEKLRARACQRIFEHIGRPELWDGQGPANAAYSHLTTLEEAPPAERTLTLCAWAIWNGRPQLSFAEFLALEDLRASALVTGYLQAAAFGDLGVNAWLASRETGTQQGRTLTQGANHD